MIPSNPGAPNMLPPPPPGRPPLPPRPGNPTDADFFQQYRQPALLQSSAPMPPPQHSGPMPGPMNPNDALMQAAMGQYNPMMPIAPAFSPPPPQTTNPFNVGSQMTPQGGMTLPDPGPNPMGPLQQFAPPQLAPTMPLPPIDPMAQTNQMQSLINQLSSGTAGNIPQPAPKNPTQSNEQGAPWTPSRPTGSHDPFGNPWGAR